MRPTISSPEICASRQTPVRSATPLQVRTGAGLVLFGLFAIDGLRTAFHMALPRLGDLAAVSAAAIAGVVWFELRKHFANRG